LEDSSSLMLDKNNKKGCRGKGSGKRRSYLSCEGRAHGSVCQWSLFFKAVRGTGGGLHGVQSKGGGEKVGIQRITKINDLSEVVSLCRLILKVDVAERGGKISLKKRVRVGNLLGNKKFERDSENFFSLLCRSRKLQSQTTWIPMESCISSLPRIFLF